MQRTTAEGVIISCDFCGADWDQVRPMIEGHKGSVLCLDCLKQALLGARAGAAFTCTMCLQDRPADVAHWAHPPSEARQVAALNAEAVICADCIHQAAGTFSKDPDVNWTWDRKKVGPDGPT